MKNAVVCFIGTIILFNLVSCKKDSTIQESVDGSQTITSSAELEPYLDRFILEGRARGFTIPTDLDGLTYTIENIPGGGAVGICRWNSQTPNHITVDEDFWNGANDALKEHVVFHELGHCYLNRDHDDSAFTNGVCQSIMHSGTTGNCRHVYTAEAREYYVNELFGAP